MFQCSISFEGRDLRNPEIMLRMKKIPEEIVSDAVEGIPAEEYEDTLRKLLKGKAKTIKESGKREKFSKLISFAHGCSLLPRTNRLRRSVI